MLVKLPIKLNYIDILGFMLAQDEGSLVPEKNTLLFKPFVRKTRLY